MSHLIPDDKTTEGYTPTTQLDQSANLADTIVKLNEVIQKLEEVVAMFIGEVSGK